MRQYIAAMAVLCLFLILGCAQFENENAPTNGAAKQSNVSELVTAENLSDFIRIEVQPTTKAEKYMVYFGWPKLSESARVRIRMEQTLAVVEYAQTTFSHEVTHNQTLTYTFDVLGADSKIQKSFSKQVKVPRDFVVREGQNQFSEDTRLQVNRIFMAGTPLRTNGFNVEIFSNELIADKGIIETFPEGTKAPANQDGRGAGVLTLNIGTASGSLKVFMRGEHGGDGTKGPSYGGRAPDGGGAGDGSVECDCVGRMCNLTLSVRTLLQTDEVQPQAMSCVCSSYGHDAGNGATGAKGNKGLPARNGGSSGALKVTIKDGSAFDIQAYKTFGLAGAPGEGGDGQPGGNGGPGRNGNSRRDCRGSAGSGGATGPKGDSGDLAADGVLGPICVYIASEGKNDCY